MEVMEAILKRRSIRKYKEEQVDKQVIETLLKAAMAAPSACNKQPWEFIVVDNTEKLNELKNQLQYGKYNAPAGIVVCGNTDWALCKDDKGMWIQDCSAAVQNILLSATGLGLGSVWVGIYPVKDRVKTVQHILNMPEQVLPLGMIYIGYPDEEKEPRTQYEERRVHWQKYE